ncbi:SGNH/GDSL hydrolase family protein [Ensifer sp. OTU672]|uniref:SGNH/GDSL hydrolase family protein n=1 Tax=Ensifer sp. OTU672 TaxID=3043861 RepID=UPI00313B3E29
MAEITDAFKTAFPDGPTSNPDDPNKEIVRAIGRAIDSRFADVQASIDGIASFASSGAKWAALGPVALATTGNVTLSGEQTIDGTMTSASRVLVWKENTPSQNGLYTTSPGAWSRTADADTAAEMLGLAVSVSGGTVNGGKSFICQAIAPITIGTTALPFVEMTNQSAFTASISAVSTDVARTNTKFDSVLRSATQHQSIGAAAPTSGGTDSSASTYVLNDQSDFDGAITSFKIFANAATTITVGSFSRSSSDVFTRQDSQTISVIPGLQTISVRVRIDKGWYPGFTTSVNGAVQHIAASNAGFFNGTLSGESFTDSVAGTTNELQVNFTIDQLAANRDGPLFNLTKTLPQIIGVTGNPVTGSNAVSGTIILGSPAESDAIINRIRWWTLGAVTGVVGVYKKVGTAAVRVKTLARVTTVPNDMNTLYLNDIIEKGQFIGFQSASNGFIVLTAASAGSSYYYDAAATTGDNASAATLRTDATWQVSIDLTRIAGQKHEVTLENVDRLLMVGPSYQGSYYGHVGKHPIGKVSQFTDYNCENFSYGGHTIREMNDRLRLNVVTGYAPVLPKKMGTVRVFLTGGWNDQNESVTFATYQNDIRDTIRLLKSMGAIPVLCSEWQPVYNPAAHAVYKALAEELGVEFVNFVPHTQRMVSGTPYGGFWQGLSGPNPVRHPGVRTGSVIADVLEKYVQTLDRPANAIKVFRKRTSVSVSDINTDLMFAGDYARGKLFRELYLNQASLSPSTTKYFDELSTGSYDQNYITQSEYLLWQNGDTLTLGEYVLIEVTIDAVLQNVDLFSFTLSDPSVTLYAMDQYKSGGPGYVAVTGVDGVFTLKHEDLPGKMNFDKLTFLLYKSGGMTLAEPVIEWYGEAGKPRYPVLARPAATGAELLRKTKFAPADMTGNKATGWAAVDQNGSAITITPSSDATYQIPYDTTHFIVISNVARVVQTLDYTTDNFEDREVEVRLTPRYFPVVFNSSGTYPGGSSITEDTFDYREIVVEWFAPDGFAIATQRQKSGPWWNDEITFRANLPIGVGPVDVRISCSDGELELAKVSVKRV